MYRKWNERQAERYRAAGLWTDRTLLDYWNGAVAAHPDAVYVTDNLGKSLTYRETDRQAGILAAWMKRQGVHEGHKITIQCTPRVEFVLLTVACWKLGAVLVPVKMRTGEAEWVRLAKLIRSRLHFAVERYHKENYKHFVLESEKQLPGPVTNIFIGEKLDGEGYERNFRMDEILAKEPEPAPGELPTPKGGADAIAVILFTSGTTMGSRGVLLSHNNVISSELSFVRALGLGPDDGIFMPAPLSHATGFHHGVVAMMLCGGKLSLMDQYERYKALELMDRERSSFTMGATPFIYDYLRCMDEGVKKPESLRFAVCGGAPVSFELTNRAWTAHGLMVCECYGSTESVPHALVRPEEAMALEGKWSGSGLEGVEIRIVGKDGKDVQPGEVGEEWSRGPNVFLGYLDDPENTDRVLDDEGWYHSGDLCYGDTAGHIKISGRIKDIIVRGGENLNVNEIEANLMGCPGVESCAVVGMEDPRLGERVCAFIVPKNPARPVTKEELTAFLEEKKVSKWLWPEHVEYIDALPYTDSGKIQRYRLREELKRRREAGGNG